MGRFGALFLFVASSCYEVMRRSYRLGSASALQIVTSGRPFSLRISSILKTTFRPMSVILGPKITALTAAAGSNLVCPAAS